MALKVIGKPSDIIQVLGSFPQEKELTVIFEEDTTLPVPMAAPESSKPRQMGFRASGASLGGQAANASSTDLRTARGTEPAANSLRPVYQPPHTSVPSSDTHASGPSTVMTYSPLPVLTVTTMSSLVFMTESPPM